MASRLKLSTNASAWAEKVRLRTRRVGFHALARAFLASVGPVAATKTKVAIPVSRSTLRAVVLRIEPLYSTVMAGASRREIRRRRRHVLHCGDVRRGGLLGARALGEELQLVTGRISVVSPQKIRRPGRKPLRSPTARAGHASYLVPVPAALSGICRGQRPLTLSAMRLPQSFARARSRHKAVSPNGRGGNA